MSHRIEQINKLIQKYLSQAIHKELELAPGVLVTITKVQTGADLKLAKILVSILPDEKQDEVLAAIGRKKKILQAELARNLTMKFSPKIEFVIDVIESQANKIEAILDSLNKLVD